MSNHEIRQNVKKTLDELKPKIGLKTPGELRLSGLAKDIGGALVLLSFVETGICWFVIFLGWTLRTFVK